MLLIIEPQGQQQGRLLPRQDAAVDLIGVLHIEVAVDLLLVEPPAHDAQIIGHQLMVDGQKGIVRVLEPAPIGQRPGPGHIGAAEQPVAHGLELFQLPGRQGLYGLQVHGLLLSHKPQLRQGISVLGELAFQPLHLIGAVPVAAMESCQQAQHILPVVPEG